MTTDEIRLRIKSIWDNADRLGRDPTDSERREVERLLAAIEAKKARDIASEAFRALGGDGYERGQDGGLFGGPGDLFIKSDGYKQISDPAGRAQRFSSGLIEVSSGPLSMDTKGTLTESGVGGPGGGLVPPGYDPGIVSKLFEPLAVQDVFATAATSASQMRYVVEGTATSAAAGVAEGAVKPESTFAFSETVEPIRKLATSLTVSDELLEDAPSMQSYLNGRLGLFVKIEEERQLLRGAGSGSNELVGMFGRSGINQYTRAAADDNAVALARVLANTRGSSHLQPDAIVMHPSNWLTTRLLRDGTGGTAGGYLGTGPFGTSYGVRGAADAGLFGQMLWDTPVVLSTVVGAGTALVGSFSLAARIWRRGGVSVEASNSHDDFWVRNLVSLRAESRLGLGVYRPAAFTEVRGLT